MKDISYSQFQIPADRLESQFTESKPGFTQSEALMEANRCLFCFDAPCTKACPADINIPAFINKITTGNLRGAGRTILASNMLGASTARVCPVEELCAGACVYLDYNQNPIQIGRLQRFAVEQALEQERNHGRKIFQPRKQHPLRVALVGAGPASFACAAYLALEGVHPVIFEKNELPGGLNLSAIAPYKLQSEEALAEVNWLLTHGIELKTNTAVGRDINVENLTRQYDAVFIGTGLGKDKFLGLPGESTPGVWGASDLIRKIKNEPGFNLPDGLHSVVVIGGGNTAIDISRELASLGIPDVNILYRKTESVMKGYAHELAAAKKSGVRLIENIMPVEILHKQDAVTGLKTINTLKNTPIVFDADWIVYAIGQEKQVADFTDLLELDPAGCIIVDPATSRTNHENIYAGGDAVNGGKEVVNAAADGRIAAFAMLKSWNIQPELERIIKR